MSPTPSDDALLATLVANRFRVAVVECLADRSTLVGLDELAELVARRCVGAESPHLKVALHHVHLETLARFDLIDYDAASLTVDRVSADALDALLTRIDAVDAVLPDPPGPATTAAPVETHAADPDGDRVDVPPTYPDDGD